MGEHKVARFSSYRGVSFEINPEKTSPFSITTPPLVETPQESSNATWLWLPWTRRSSFKVFPVPLTGSFHRSLSRPSNHFCDLDVDKEDDDETIYEDDEDDLEVFTEKDLEKQNSVRKPSFGSKPSIKRQESLLRKLPPKKTQSRLSIILLDQGLFTVYKRLFIVCFTLNMIGLILTAIGRFPYAKEKASLFSIANIIALVLYRSETKLRTATTSFLQCLGGVHSGCGVSAIANSYKPSQQTYDFSLSRFIKTQEFWFTLVITIVIILPWLTVRQVPVRVSAPSNHASIIKFEGGIKAGILGRISPSPVSEWHAFGIISDGKDEHMMLAGAVGDFTKTLVSNPPSHLWVGGVHFAGLPYLVNMYERVVLVATGSGICVFLSFLLQPFRADVCVVWKWDAQVVIVTSNPEGSRDVVDACKGAGIPAFGPIWDS
ncbi:hypothetical protein MKX01_042114 [Papaver californicum]|nr:hypothetical protein MKX01_042114 [Papaver californicum]